MKNVNKLTLLALAAVFVLTAAVSAAVGYGAGVANGSNMREIYPSFFILMSRPVKPEQNDKKGFQRYEREGREYVEAAERYLKNALDDIERISFEADTVTSEANDFIAEYNTVMQENY